MKKVLMMLLINVVLLHAVPQGILKPKKHSRSQLRERIFEYHSAIPQDSFSLEQEKLNGDKFFFKLSMKLLDQSANNPVEKASMEQLEQHIKALENYKKAIKEAHQALKNAAKELEQSPLN